mgnify:CR=1 FL=1
MGSEMCIRDRARAAAPAAGTEVVVREARGARRRRETRARLLDAALKLMADRGMDGVAVNEITCLLYTSDAADEGSRVDLGGPRIFKKKNKKTEEKKKKKSKNAHT